MTDAAKSPLQRWSPDYGLRVDKSGQYVRHDEAMKIIQSQAERIAGLEAELKRRMALTDEVRQDITKKPTEPDAVAAYLVFGQSDWSENLFHEFREAENYATRQMEGSDQQSYSVYPLYAAEPIVVS